MGKISLYRMTLGFEQMVGDIGRGTSLEREIWKESDVFSY